MQLKNKGKYDIGFSFSFTKASNGKSYSNMFKVAPAHTVLYPGEKSQAVNVVFHSTEEVALKDEPILKCEVCACACTLYMMHVCRLVYHDSLDCKQPVRYIEMVLESPNVQYMYMCS